MNENNGSDFNSLNDHWLDPSDGTGDRNSDWINERRNLGLVLDWDTADRITIANLKHLLDCIYEREHNHKVFNSFYHEEDKKHDRKIKKAIKRVLKYFGEEE